MDKCILVDSVTYAQKAKYLLESEGISSYIAKQNVVKDRGCAWCVKIHRADETKSLEILHRANIKLSGGVYEL